MHPWLSLTAFVDQAGFELTEIPLLCLPERWDYRCVPRSQPVLCFEYADDEQPALDSSSQSALGFHSYLSKGPYPHGPLQGPPQQRSDPILLTRQK